MRDLIPSLSLPALAALAAGVATLQLLAPPPASACGGFFCSQLPIEQQGEQILFTVEGSTVAATIQITYQGEAHDFAWVVPVVSKPEITVSPAAVFQVLEQTTRPQWWLRWDDSGQCGWWLAPEASQSPGDTGAGGGVDVLETREVGPYETATVKSDSAQDLFDWLNKYGYDQPPESLPLIEHYVSNNMLFVALKLKSDADTGDIQPVTLTFEEGDPCVPLILTRIAASPDMPVRIFMLGEARAVPTNWMHVVVNQKKIDWLSGGSNYNDVVTQAIDEAAGHGFVTEYAGDASMLKERLWREGQYDLDALAEAGDAASFIEQMLSQRFPRDSQVQNLIRTWIPKPDDAELPEQCQGDNQFYATWQLAECLKFMPEGWTFDAEGFAQALDDAVITPLRLMQAAIDKHPYLTRLYTTVSPDEMTRDPIFSYNPDLPDVSNIHQAQASGECGDNGSLTSVTITLDDGESFTLTFDEEFQPWQGLPPELLPAGPFAARVELLAETGSPILLTPDEVAAVDERMDRETPEAVFNAAKAGTLTLPAGNGANTSGPSGCSGSPTAPMPLIALLGLMALAIIRRRG